jgi:hypothetical protein
MALAARIGLHNVGIHSKALTTDQILSHAALQHRLKQLPERITVPEPAMPVLGEGGMIRHLAYQTQPAKPPIGQVEMNFFTQAPFRANAIAIANVEHADHHLGIDRVTTGRTVERRKVCAQVA